MDGSVADALDLAADVLEHGGWIQNREWSPAGHCVVGALEVCCGDKVLYPAAKAIGARVGCGILGITGWNDDPARTADEVIETLRACAQSIREGSDV